MSMPTLSPAEVGSTYLLDVRETDEFAAGHAPGAVHLAMSEIEARLSEVPVGVPLAVICRVGSRSANVVAWLRHQGYDAANVEGGMLAWQRMGLPVEGFIV